MSAAMIIQLVLAVLSALPQLIQAIESLHTQAGAGPVKKGLVLDLVAKALTVAGTADPKLAKLLTPDLQKQIQDLAGQTVDSAVTLMNTDAPKPGG
jgi:hypothetical protein